MPRVWIVRTLGNDGRGVRVLARNAVEALDLAGVFTDELEDESWGDWSLVRARYRGRWIQALRERN